MVIFVGQDIQESLRLPVYGRSKHMTNYGEECRIVLQGKFWKEVHGKSGSRSPYMMDLDRRSVATLSYTLSTSVITQWPCNTLYVCQSCSTGKFQL